MAQHWLYPINPHAGYHFVDASSGDLIETTVENLWRSVEEEVGPDDYTLTSGYKQMRPGDHLWIYAGSPRQEIVAYGLVDEIYDNGGEMRVRFWWDVDVTRALADSPISLAAIGGRAPQSVSRTNRTQALEKFLNVHGGLAPIISERDYKGDGRRWINMAIVMRQGRAGFRSLLLSIYRARCAVTGCSVDTVLDAAHIAPYKGLHTNTAENGLLLRTDVHTLFDRHLLGIDQDYRVVLSPALRKSSDYGSLEGARITVPRLVKERPSKALLAEHLTSVAVRH